MPRSGVLPQNVGDEVTSILVRTPPIRRSQPPPTPGAAARGKRARQVSFADTASETGSPRGERARAAKSPRKPARGRRISVAWFAVLIVAGIGGLGGFYMFEQWQTAEEEARAATFQAIAANERAALADQRAIEVQAAHSRELSEHFRGTLDGATKRSGGADELAAKLEKIVGEYGTVVRDKHKLTLEMVDKVLFRPGEASLTERGEKVLADVGEALKKFPEQQIWVQGHTDNIPIARAEFASNWELSSARALTVVHYLEDEATVDPRRMAAVGFGEHRPVSRAERFRNGRIEIALFPREVRLIKD